MNDDMQQKQSGSPFPELERATLNLWKERRIFEKINARTDCEAFVFYEGPPTANAGPGLHHMIARAFKDVMCRYKTLRGYRVLRKAGWDTHGLPVELQVEKEIGTKTKSDIEKFGIAAFNAKCKESVWKFKQDWDRFTERIGYWLDLEHPYITYDPQYMETLWWILKKVWQKGLLVQDYKVVPYCTRCGTVLSSHEVAQGYEDTQDESVYIKFKVADSKYPNAYFLVWTTTPWTLFGNVALAVNPKIEYAWVKSKQTGEVVICAKERLAILDDEYELVQNSSGKDLVGMRYEPIFPYINDLKPQNIENAFQVLPADFATATDGTGIVHIAPMYGVDDSELGRQHKLPFVHTVDVQGDFVSEVKLWAGKPAKASDPEIRQWLKDNNVLYKTESITHTYPFCWRCHTPLLYYAHQSWFIRMTALKDKLIANNEQIRWVPEHLKEGRFGEWLRDVKDWAISRERYWGTPLPVWVCEKDQSHKLCIGSYKELSQHAYQPNTYLLVRHGQARANVEGYLAPWPEKPDMVSTLTETGKQQERALAQSLAQQNIHVDMIVSSDLTRTKQTAEIFHAQFPDAELVFDERLREISGGAYAYRPVAEYEAFHDALKDRPLEELFAAKPEGGESYNEIQQRMLDVVREYDAKYHGKTIVLISHGDPLWLLEAKLTTDSLAHAQQIQGFGLAEMRRMSSPNFPYGQNGEVDPHRPFVDAVVCACPQCGGAMKRVPEVIDVWFDSGAMPFAQFHFPFEQTQYGQDPLAAEYQKLLGAALPFPAQYISEAIDQTRGWFYTLLAIGTLLDAGPAFLNAISMGHIVDEHGEKMSKSKGNIVDAWKMFDAFGADALRWYFYTINDPGEYKRFSEKDVRATSHQELMTILNVLKFWQMYPAPQKLAVRDLDSSATVANPLDEWMAVRMNALITAVTEHMEQYRVFEASRELEAFIDDLSRWYIRESRPRFRDENELPRVSLFTAKTLMDFAVLLSPFVPFLAEHMWQSIRAAFADSEKIPESVHMAQWPAYKQTDASNPVLANMKIVRSLAERLLALRAKTGIKVRQPLGNAYVTQKGLSEGSLTLLADEINVKKISVVDAIPQAQTRVSSGDMPDMVALDTEITEELKQDGAVRELVRDIQGKRQEVGLLPRDTITVTIPGTSEYAFLKTQPERLAYVQGATNATSIVWSSDTEVRIEKA